MGDCETSAVRRAGRDRGGRPGRTDRKPPAGLAAAGLLGLVVAPAAGRGRPARRARPVAPRRGHGALAYSRARVQGRARRRRPSCGSGLTPSPGPALPATRERHNGDEQGGGDRAARWPAGAPASGCAGRARGGTAASGGAGALRRLPRLPRPPASAGRLGIGSRWARTPARQRRRAWPRARRAPQGSRGTPRVSLRARPRWPRAREPRARKPRPRARKPRARAREPRARKPRA